MKKIILMGTVTLMGMLFSGCSNQELMMAQSAANGAMGAQSTASYFNASLNTVGVVQGQAAGFSTFANPMALGTIAAVGALSAKRAEDNKKGYADMTSIMASQDMSGDMVKAYNKKYGTHYRTMAELQHSQKI